MTLVKQDTLLVLHRAIANMATSTGDADKLARLRNSLESLIDPQGYATGLRHAAYLLEDDGCPLDAAGLLHLAAVLEGR